MILCGTWAAWNEIPARGSLGYPDARVTGDLRVLQKTDFSENGK